MVAGGRVFLYRDNQRHCEPGLDRIKAENVPLVKGWNAVLVGIAALDRDWIFNLRIRDEHGHEPPAGLWYTAEAPTEK